MKLFQKGAECVGVCEDGYIYLVSVYEATSNSAALQSEQFVKTTKPLKITNKLLSTRKKKDTKWIRRFIELKYAPETYLRNQGFKAI